MKQAVLLVGTTLASALVWTMVAPAVPIAQPLAFNHAKHTAGLTCVACHSGVMTSAQATLPSGDTCLRCHASAPASVSEASWRAIQQTAAAPAWIPVTRLPEHVMFSHRRHVVLARLACESCHADIGTRAGPPPRAPMRLAMDTCLSCHRQEGASEDCAACHR